jgi:hypothetical protein
VGGFDTTYIEILQAATKRLSTRQTTRQREVPWYEPATALAVSKPRGDDKCTND